MSLVQFTTQTVYPSSLLLNFLQFFSLNFPAVFAKFYYEKPGRQPSMSHACMSEYVRFKSNRTRREYPQCCHSCNHWIVRHMPYLPLLPQFQSGAEPPCG